MRKDEKKYEKNIFIFSLQLFDNYRFEKNEKNEKDFSVFL